MSPRYPSRAVIDHAALAANFAALAARTRAAVMPIVKADAYGHGLAPCVRTLAAAGARIVGVAQLAEALELAATAAAGAPEIFAWLYSPHQRAELVDAVRAGIHLGVPGPWALDAIADAVRAAGGPRARVHLQVDTGMSRAGARPEALAGLLAAAAACREVEVVGMWSHLARADDDPDTTARQNAAFEAALARAASFPLRYAHLAASGGLLWHPATHHTTVRPGIALFGVAPDDSDPAAFGLTPVMRLEADLISVKPVPADTPVSYGHTARVGPTTLGVVPLGYADGIDRTASNAAAVTVGGRRCPVVGRICMDQFVVDLGPESAARAGDPAIVWGPGGPSVSEWARAAGSIGYEIIARLGPRVARIGEGMTP